MSEPCHALVFRDVRQQLCLRAASDAICNEISDFIKSGDGESLVSALLRAGEVECALADNSRTHTGNLTYLLAAALVDPAAAPHLCAIARSQLNPLPSAETVGLSRPEGFAFYGLHPL